MSWFHYKVPTLLEMTDRLAERNLSATWPVVLRLVHPFATPCTDRDLESMLGVHIKRVSIRIRVLVHNNAIRTPLMQSLGRRVPEP
jgi:hypothetical protein